MVQIHLGAPKFMTEKNKKLIAQETDNKKRLDVFLSENLEITRSQAQKLIENEQILINDKEPKKAGDRVKPNDIIKIIEKTKLDKTNSQEITDKKNKEIIIKPEIVWEDKNYLVINKPSGLLVHPTPANETNTLTAFLSKQYPEIKKVGDNPTVRPGIVHRLDKEASGLLLIARTKAAFKLFKEEFKTRQVKKEYLVLVHGKIDRDEGVIDFPLGRKPDGRMAAMPKMDRGLPTDFGKPALTEFWVEQKFSNFTLLRVRIHSGRMHQIRAHFLAYNHPVVGDVLYHQKQYAKWSGRLNRLFLHCATLGFFDLKNDWVEYESNLPAELAEFLKTL